MELNKTEFFNYPLIIYKRHSPDAIRFTKLIINTLLSKTKVTKISIEIDYLSELKLEEKIANKIQTFDYQKLTKENSFDICIVIGGDGTLLWAQYILSSFPLPYFLPFNLGTLGFLNIYDIDHYEEILLDVFKSKISNLFFDNRSMIEARYLNSKETNVFCLNEIVFHRGSGNKLIHFDLYMNDYHMTNLNGDGLIISTSTGSTAYSLSNSGTILHQSLECMMINAICPHSLSFRPIVLPKNFEIKVVVGKKSEKVFISSDGIDLKILSSGEGMAIRLSEKQFKIILLKDSIKDYQKVWLNRLNKKLGWSKSFVKF